MNIELLELRRTARFVEYCMQHDMQVKVNRGSALTLLQSSIARPSDPRVIEFGSEKFDKMVTFLASTDQQVHYAGPGNTVGVYAITRLLGELRRQIRDAEIPQGEDFYMDMASPRDPTIRRPVTREARQADQPRPVPAFVSADELQRRVANAQRQLQQKREMEVEEYNAQREAGFSQEGTPKK